MKKVTHKQNLRKIVYAIRGFLILIFFYLLGEGLVKYLKVPLPGNVLGMLLIFITLQTGILRLEQVKFAAGKLLAYLALFFVPYGVGLIQYESMLAQYGWAMLLSVVISTFFTLWMSAFVFDKLLDR
ncbi:CidA/LrgA family protein [Rapidithrix thailandica]|uniref:CidA/LrgA family protein n=1 Tax=Rapidithrix thailandica TaxID=413964 RepID=A0AAW9SHG2_9BACT